jgi:hypothetical protein
MILYPGHADLKFIGHVGTQQQPSVRLKDNFIEAAGRRAPNSIVC